MTLRLSGGRRLMSPPGEQARPTAARVRLAVMNLLAGELRDCRWLDLCCGSGVMACEALQRGARQVVAVERDRRIAAVARSNLESVAAGQNGERSSDGTMLAPAVHCADALTWLKGGPAARGLDPFDLIYLDPPWPAGLHAGITAAVSAAGWLAPQGTLIWECPSRPAPEIPTGWWQRQWRVYGGSAVLLLQQQAEGGSRRMKREWKG